MKERIKFFVWIENHWDIQTKVTDRNLKNLRMCNLQKKITTSVNEHLKGNDIFNNVKNARNQQNLIEQNL
jgi:hypothetical protein